MHCVCGFRHVGKVEMGQTPFHGPCLWDHLQDRAVEGGRLFISTWVQLGA